ncbi:FAD-dependent monooxygenase [Nonomuraea sp. SBT364]|uniref:FAD-dependent monooxygenase n=1 Tax=Nonomuraea sp. SBT364 TaxID=1580530 RepID=UPI00069F355C|nr:FAD-dependent monooxygenase [Nonomuraea sp. SBT364]
MNDVVIVGAGPVGLMLAGELGLAAARALVLDKRLEPSELPRANGLTGQAVDLLDQRGLLKRFGKGSSFSGKPPRFPFGPVTLPLARLDVPFRALIIQQPRLERLLAERAVELGAEIRRGWEVRSLTQDEQGVTLAVEDDRQVRARFAVGCDGGRSPVRQQVGIGFPGTTDDQVLRLGHFRGRPELDGLKPGWNEFPHGRVLLTSLRRGVHVVGVREKGEAGPVTADGFRAALRRVTGRDLPLGEPIWLTATVAQARLAERYRAGRVFLAGDAAHLFPAGGSALNVGLTDAAELAAKLAAHLAGAPARVLDAYESERRPLAERTLAHTRAQAALERLSGEDGAALRDLLTEVFAYEEPARHLAALLHGSRTPYVPPGAAGQRRRRRFPLRASRA